MYKLGCFAPEPRKAANSILGLQEEGFSKFGIDKY